MSNRIASLSVTIDGTTYHYEAHSLNRVAEILAGTLRVLDTGKTNDFGQPIYSNTIEDFQVHYFQESN